MTIDKTKLKAACEAAGGVTWSWWTSNSTLRLTTERDGRHGADGDAISAHADSVQCSVIYREFIELASPAIVQALIAENERVNARLCVCRDCAGRGEIYSGHDSYQGYNQPPEPDMDVCGTCGGDGVLGPLEDFESLAAERDRLKVENEKIRAFMAEISQSSGDKWAVMVARGLMGVSVQLDAAMGEGEQS